MTETWAFVEALPPDLMVVKALLYDRCGYVCTLPIAEPESSEYGACTFFLNTRHIKFRVAKTTPKKIGLFVTLWSRNEAGVTQPHRASDPIDLFVISARKEHSFGQFVFPKSALIKHGIISTPEREGKRGFRIYPPWDPAENKQAQKTQQWQLEFFLEIAQEKPLDLERAKLLYASK